MRKFYSRNICSTSKLKYIFLFLIVLSNYSKTFAQNTPAVGDFKSNSSGNWSNHAVWQIFDGVAWQPSTSGTIPNNLSSVYLESGHTITLDIEGNCNRLFINNFEDVVRLNTQENKLNVNGKLVLYSGSVTTTMGAPLTTSAVTPPLQLINTGANGSIKVVGGSRELIRFGEFNANLRNSGWTLEIEINQDAVATIDETVRFGRLIVNSGTLDIGDDDRMFVDISGVTPQINGSVLIKTGATIRGSVGFFKSNSAPMSSFTIENGGHFLIRTTNHTLAAQTLNLSGTLGLIANLAQAFPASNNDARTRAGSAVVENFSNLITDLSGNKQLRNNITVNGIYTKSGSTNIDLNGFTLGYGPEGGVEYAGSAAQTTTNVEFPAASGPAQLIINNAAGVNLHSSRVVSMGLTLENGILNLGNNNLTIGASGSLIGGNFSNSSMVAINGTGELRKNFGGVGTFTFPVGERNNITEYTPITVEVTDGIFDPNAYLGVRVINEKHPNNSTVDYLNRYWTISTQNLSDINYNTQATYTPEDIIGTEGNISSFIYSVSQPILVSSINAANNTITFQTVSLSGDLTGANYCDVENNILSSHTAGAGLFCTESPAFQIKGSQPTSSGNILYQWEMSLNSELFSEITEAQNQNLEVAIINVPGVYEFRRIVRSDLCNSIYISDTLKIEILPSIENILIANTGAGNLCLGSTPHLFSGTTPTGGNNVFTFNWERSYNQGAWETVGITETFQEAELTVPGVYHYRRIVSSAHCSTESEMIEINVNSIMNVTGIVTDAIDVEMGAIDLSVIGGTAPYTYNWSNGSIIQDLAGVTAGTYTIQVTDAYNCQSSAEFTVAQVTSISDIKKIEFNIYPNPVKDQFVIKTAFENPSLVSISVSNLNGKTVYGTKLKNVSTLSHEVNISDLPAGVYIVNVTVDGKTTFKKVIKN